jgi:hypothetical protein
MLISRLWYFVFEIGFETGEDRKYVIFETLNGSVSIRDVF